MVLGRRAELQRLERWRDSIGEGPRALVLEGDAGIGKTALWNECVAQSRTRLHWVLSSRAVSAELKLPFVVLGDLLDTVADDLVPQLPEVQERALNAALLRGGVDAPLDARAVGIAVLNVLRRLADVAPVLVAIDDAQWVDAASARALQFALRRLETEPVGALATVRTGAEAAFALDGAERMVVEPLGPDALHELVRRRLGRTLTRPELRRIERESAGNPLYALELARSGVPASLAALLSARLAALSARTRRALLAAALAQEPTLETVVAAAGGTERALARAFADGVVTLEARRVAFTHPLLAALVVESASPSAQRAMHATLASVVAGEDERVRHLALAAAEPDAAVAAALDAAAARARIRGAPDETVELLALARRLTPPEHEDDVRRRALEQARALFAAGDTRGARALLEDVVSCSPPGAGRAAAVGELGRLHNYLDNHREALEHLRAARAEAGDDPLLAATIERDTAFALGALGRVEEVGPAARRARRLARRAGDTQLAAEAAGLIAVSTTSCGGPVDLRALRKAAELATDEHRPIELSPQFAYATALKAFDRADEARAALLAIRKELVDRGNDGPLAYLSTQLAENEANAGNLDAALGYLDDAVRYAAQTGTLAPLAPASYLRTLTFVLAGRVAEARASAVEALHEAERCSWPPGAIQTRAALGLLELSLGNIDEAVAALRVLDEPETPAYVKARRLGDAIEALTAAGALDRAEARLTELSMLAARSGRPTSLGCVDRGRALLALACGDVRPALAAAERSVERFARLPARIELGRSLTVLGICERRARKRGDARATLTRAIDVLEGAALFAGRAQHELERIGGRRASSELTPSEARIAELAAEGRRNREIAAELFLTEKTVEAALSRAYRKLGVRSRSELARKL